MIQFFFDPDADTPQFLPEAKTDEMWEMVLTAAEAADIPPEIIHAMRKTGRIVMAENVHYLTPGELEEWNSAIDELNTLKHRNANS